MAQMNSLSDPKTKKICYIFHPKYLDYVDFEYFDLVVYHLYDDFDILGHGQWKEKSREAVMRADLVIASSDVVASKLRRIKSNGIYHIPNGVDYEFFAQEDLKALDNRPRPFGAPCIGYVGSVNEKLDFELVDDLSDHLSSTKFLIAGRVVNLSVSDQVLWDRIKAKNNVEYLGQLELKDVPGVIADLDMVGLFYRTTDEKFGFACDPLKLYEALAVGRQIISSDIQAVKRFEDVVTICQSIEDWEKAIVTYGPDGVEGAQLRREVAKRNTWDQRVKEILRIFEKQLSDN
ncbi:hypothetical protein GCM10007071_29380 [Marinobacter zhanjiangensis]|uniref:Glycosyl transferases group 1 n=2 Tax=Marinobacter zhanjiangensis TaxID=578215 RepID=A0ABQ3B9P5_9GAMM|nr:hypothetical protein GCM10007071_29380 [Marinobacter zhanjiangensis]